MEPLDVLHALAGNWTGTSRLWLNPSEPPYECRSTVWVISAARGKFMRLDYTWDYQGEPQEGALLLGHERERNIVTAVWIDSWHMGAKYMACEGKVTDGAISVRGSYAAPPGPDWGWRTVIEPRGADSFRLDMYNITPDGQAALAVEALYHKVG
jgi:Protein of unknown function (DUF1579)